MRKIIYEHPAVKLYVYEKTVYADWMLSASSLEIKETLNEIINLVNERQYRNWIDDTSRSLAASAGDTLWMHETWIAKSKAGISHEAIIVADYNFNRLREIARFVNDQVGISVNVKVFLSVKKAETWLASTAML